MGRWTVVRPKNGRTSRPGGGAQTGFPALSPSLPALHPPDFNGDYSGANRYDKGSGTRRGSDQPLEGERR